VASAATVAMGPAGSTNATLTVTLAGASATDVLSIVSGAGVVVTGNSIKYNNVAFATFTGGTGGVPLVVSFNGAPNAQGIQAVIEHIVFSNSSTSTVISDRMMSMQLVDGAGAGSAVVAKTIHVIPPPTVANIPSTVNYTPNVGASVFLAPSATVAMGPAGSTNARLTVGLGGASAGDQLTIVAGGGVSIIGSTIFYNNVAFATFSGGAGGVPLSVFFNGPPNAQGIQAVIDRIAFSNTSTSAPTNNRTVSFQLVDGAGAGSNVANQTIKFV